MTSQRDQVMKGLKHLTGSDEIIGDIVAYCVNSYKADPSDQTMNKIKQYVSDTANSVSEHVLTIAHNLNRIIDSEANQIETMSSQISYVHHRLKINQTYMSELYMTKFQTFPRPRPTLHILRQTVPDEQLPKYARPKKPWVRSKTVFIKYGVFDKINRSNKNVSRSPSGRQVSAGSGSEEGGNNKHFNHMGNGIKHGDGGMNNSGGNMQYVMDGIGFGNVTGNMAGTKSSGLGGISPYQQSRISGLNGVRSLQNVNGVVQQPISFGQKSGLNKQKKQRSGSPPIPMSGGPPPNPMGMMGAGGPPPNPMGMMGAGGPPPNPMGMMGAGGPPPNPMGMMGAGGPPPVPMMMGGGGPGAAGPGAQQNNSGNLPPVPNFGGPPPPPSF